MTIDKDKGQPRVSQGAEAGRGDGPTQGRTGCSIKVAGTTSDGIRNTVNFLRKHTINSGVLGVLTRALLLISLPREAVGDRKLLRVVLAESHIISKPSMTPTVLSSRFLNIDLCLLRVAEVRRSKVVVAENNIISRHPITTTKDRILGSNMVPPRAVKDDRCRVRVAESNIWSMDASSSPKNRNLGMRTFPHRAEDVNRSGRDTIPPWILVTKSSLCRLNSRHTLP